MTDVSDQKLIEIFERTKTIAVVGFSMNPARPSHYVSAFLRDQGYRVIPVNPGHAGKEIWGETIRASLADIDAPVQMVDIFRRPEAVPEVVEAALEHLKGLETIWMQLGVMHEGAAEIARAAGVDVVMNRCPKIEIPRLRRQAGA
ncbi:CoA-binding protein [Cognatishimia sp. SS12]|uniref:CoA-binding protein n=1 Tax=Cognatishimia sp. SS12 TaxID=2979465 RepID=UPI00232C7E22|nr:CoA-binding protein [Cognatishimia sp. SS12]MDC0738829.1 CoA-binding protein [Cognatishimia sp. SS12]